jgi:SET domain-containing protein 6
MLPSFPAIVRSLHDVQDDETRLQGELSLNARHATVVRLGEKRILQAVLDKIRSALEKDKAQRKAKAQDDGKKRSKR